MESDHADHRPALNVSERNWVTYSRLASVADYDRIMEVFQEEINEAAGRRVRLVVDRNVDAYELRRFAVEQVVLERSFRGLTDLDEIRVDHSLWDEDGPGAQVLPASQREPGAAGSLLWYNPRLLSRSGAHQETLKSYDPAQQEFFSPALGRLGVSFTSLHEKGHQVANAAADKQPALRAALSLVTLATATDLERQQLERRADAAEAREEEALRTATGEQVADYDRDYRASRGYTYVTLNESPEQVRTRLLDGLPEKYRGYGPMNEMSRMHVEAHAGGYASRNFAEQEAQSVAIVATYGFAADKVSGMVNRMIMAVHKHPPDVQLADYLAYTDMIKEANKADRARDGWARIAEMDRRLPPLRPSPRQAAGQRPLAQLVERVRHGLETLSNATATAVRSGWGMMRRGHGRPRQALSGSIKPAVTAAPSHHAPVQDPHPPPHPGLPTSGASASEAQAVSLPDVLVIQLDQVQVAAAAAIKGFSDASIIQATPRNASRADLRHPSPTSPEHGRTRGGGPEIPGPANGLQQ